MSAYPPLSEIGQDIRRLAVDLDEGTIGKGEATRRLYYIASNLNLNGSPMENWKILITSTNAK